MNFLAHIYLSGSNDLIKIGNFMADGIRGNDYLNLPDEIQKGVVLHRKIDTFTDAHPIFRKSKHRLHEKYGHYSGVIMDVFYDHFLAKNWKHYSNYELEEYVRNFYQSLEENYTHLTEKTKNLMPYMMSDNWLTSYASIAGIEKILFQMSYRIKHKSHLNEAIDELQKYYKDFEEEFTQFFEEVSAYSKNELQLLNS
jgi:acyl carrier protein phosphodiesterase